MLLSSFSWFLTSPVEVSLDIYAPTTTISRAILAGDSHTTAVPSVTNDTGHHKVTGPLMVGTRGGVYVTTLPIGVVDSVDVRGVILGQDWLSVTRARVTKEIVDDWDSSWGEGHCAWFSCRYFPGE